MTRGSESVGLRQKCSDTLPFISCTCHSVWQVTTRSWVDRLTRTTQDKAACVCFLPSPFLQWHTSCQNVRSTCSLVYISMQQQPCCKPFFRRCDGLSCGRSALGCDLDCVATHPLPTAFIFIVLQFVDAHAHVQGWFTVTCAGKQGDTQSSIIHTQHGPARSLPSDHTRKQISLQGLPKFVALDPQITLQIV